jgi:methyl-accepting chemotaxis protein
MGDHLILYRLNKSMQKQLNRIERKLDAMSEQEQQLDAALQQQDQKIEALITAVNNLITAIPPGVDLTDEIAEVTNASNQVQGVTDSAVGATPPPPTEPSV